MFKKLLSNLPFNPSLIGQVSFYAQRIHRETAVRRMGFVMIALTMVLQMFAVFSPPQPTLANSSSDLIDGGFTSKAEAVSHCRQNTRHYKDIVNHYGITCADISDASTVRISPHDYNNRLHSMGRLAYGVSGETPVRIPGTGTLYLRHFWSLNHGTNYKALTGTTKYGMKFFILFDCGNLVFIGIPTPPKVCEYNKDLLASDPKCFQPCPVPGKSNIPKSSPDCVAPCPYEGKKSLPINSPQCFEPCPVDGKSDIPRSSAECFEPCPYNNTIAKNSPDCKPCEDAQTRSDLTACLRYKKSARNVTQNISDANGTTAKAGDTIEYTLSTSNVGKETIEDYVVNENISDVLDYADVVNLHGGTLDSEKVVSWPKKDIGDNQTITNTITVRIKNVIPNTPASSSDPAHFDMKMVNVYGNAVEVKLPADIVKTTELVTTQLPNTGPGTSLVIGFSLAMIIAYFFMRSRLLAKELDIVRADFGTMGGY
jgi:uncharacterized repeat protein (TIGR01451 family)